MSEVPDIPFSRPTIEEDDIREVIDTLRTGWLASGPKAARFEELFRQRLDVPHAIAVTSATAGLHLVLLALGIGEGDEVIVPSITWPSTANMVELVGARPIFADVDADTLQLDPSEVARLLTSRTKAVIPVHYAGAPSDLDAIRDVIRGKPIRLIEDAAHALGTYYRGREIGSDSEIALFSFHPTKNFTSAEGGMVICREDDLASRLRNLRFHGINRDAWQRYTGGSRQHYDVIEPGFKYNLSDLHASLGVVQFHKLDRFNECRRQLAQQYDEMLSKVSGVEPLGRVAYSEKHSWHLYVIRFRSVSQSGLRDVVIQKLREDGIGVGIHFLPIHLTSHYCTRYGYEEADLPNAEKAGKEILSLPLYPLLSFEQQMTVVESLKKCFSGWEHS